MSDVQGKPVDRREALRELRAHTVGTIADVPAADWDACASPTLDSANDDNAVEAPLQAACEQIATAIKTSGNRRNPFISHDFLSSLEASGSVGERSGWHVQHLLVKTADGALLAAAPCYIKSHSRGEYVFDRGWAEAYERAGGAYYPKLQVAVPFTPATGRRLLVGPPARRPSLLREALASGLLELCRLDEASGRARHLRHRSRVCISSASAAPAAHRPAIPLGEFQLRHCLTIGARCRRASARPSAASAAMRCATASPCIGSPAAISH